MTDSVCTQLDDARDVFNDDSSFVKHTHLLSILHGPYKLRRAWITRWLLDGIVRIRDTILVKIGSEWNPANHANSSPLRFRWTAIDHSTNTFPTRVECTDVSAVSDVTGVAQSRPSVIVSSADSFATTPEPTRLVSLYVLLNTLEVTTPDSLDLSLHNIHTLNGIDQHLTFTKHGVLPQITVFHQAE
ncbi:hypothetical protein BLNAU_10419 [Blattamonas nauphoetae]|uniref:Uncharacterized protein n=1 Tax=Blattamonas nauphoetae TaxID=2049346 RepID=A0ABQ9XQ78_9EUKA|nr:hypothetical protein BLNAU_10419 [Blattamonas nauphoetae]